MEGHCDYIKHVKSDWALIPITCVCVNKLL